MLSEAFYVIRFHILTINTGDRTEAWRLSVTATKSQSLDALLVGLAAAIVHAAVRITVRFSSVGKYPTCRSLATLEGIT